MGKYHNLEAQLQRPFRWPSEGELAFVSSNDSTVTAVISENLEFRLYSMTAGYRLAADVLVERALNNLSERELLVCPIIFAYRHYVELSLKSLIANYGGLVGIEPNWHSHRLEELWVPFKEMLDTYGNPDPDQADQRVEAIILEFAKIDPNSFSHRYPVDRTGNVLPLTLGELDLAQLKDVMEGVSNYFSGCDGFLSDLRGAVPHEVA